MPWQHCDAALRVCRQAMSVSSHRYTCAQLRSMSIRQQQ